MHQFEALSLAEISGLAKPRAVPPAFVPPHPWKMRIAAASIRAQQRLQDSGQLKMAATQESSSRPC